MLTSPKAAASVALDAIINSFGALESGTKIVVVVVVVVVSFSSTSFEKSPPCPCSTFKLLLGG